MKSLSIKTRLLLLVGGLLAVFVLAATFAVGRMRADNASLASLYDDRVVALEQLKDVADAYGNGIVDTAHKVADGTLAPPAGLAVVQQAQATVARQWKAYADSYLDDDERPLVAQAGPLMARADALARSSRRRWAAATWTT